MRRHTDILRLITIIFGAVIILFAIFGTAYLLIAKGQLRGIELTPNFAESELEVGKQYTFNLSANPDGASLKKAKCVVSDPSCSFEMTDDNEVTLTTGLAEGAVTVYVECKDFKSQVLNFNVVDLVARAQAEAEAQAQLQREQEEAQAAEEAAALQEEINKLYVKCIKENVNVRSSTDTSNQDNVLGKAQKGDVFEKIENEGEWTHLIFQGQDAYMRNDMIEDCTEDGTSLGNSEETDAPEGAETAKNEEKKEEKKNEEPASETTEQETRQTKEEAEAKAAADAAKAAEEAAAKAAEEALAAAQAELEAAAAAQAAAAAAGTVIHCKDGDCLVNSSQLNTIHATWDFAGDAVEMAGHHSISELEAVIGSVTRL